MIMHQHNFVVFFLLPCTLYNNLRVGECPYFKYSVVKDLNREGKRGKKHICPPPVKVNDLIWRSSVFLHCLICRHATDFNYWPTQDHKNVKRMTLSRGGVHLQRSLTITLTDRHILINIHPPDRKQGAFTVVQNSWYTTATTPVNMEEQTTLLKGLGE